MSIFTCVCVCVCTYVRARAHVRMFMCEFGADSLFASAVHIQVVERELDTLAWLADQLIITKDVIWIHAGIGR